MGRRKVAHLCADCGVETGHRRRKYCLDCRARRVYEGALRAAAKNHRTAEIRATGEVRVVNQIDREIKRAKEQVEERFSFWYQGPKPSNKAIYQEGD